MIKRNSETTSKIVVIGLGQRFRGDDAAGHAVIQRWQSSGSNVPKDSRVRVVNEPLPGLALLQELEGHQAALLVDAVVTGSKSGTLHLFSVENTQSFHNGASSAHGWGVAETLAIARELDLKLPDSLIILGVEAGQFKLGAELSPEVAGCLDQAVEQIETQVREWLDEVESYPLIDGIYP